MPPPGAVSHDATPPTFAAVLRRLREAAGLTQEELAERAGLTAHGVSALERGTRTRPYPHTVRSLAAGLESVPGALETLLGAVPPRTAAGPPTTGTPTAGHDGAARPAPGASGASPPPGPAGTGGAAGAGHHGVRGVPAPVTPLVGRDDDVAAVVSLLSRTTSRLVTLTGTGGVGKTRLAYAVAEAVAEEHRDGVVVVPLAAVEDAALVAPALGRAVGAATVESGDVDGHVTAELRDARMLLVLDNLEHLPGVEAFVARLLQECRGVVVLATSRAALRLRGESEYAVQPLTLPRPDARDVHEVASSPAGALLLERGRAVSPSFGTRPDDHVALAAVCERLAGIPLALELAAARARVLDAPSLLHRLEDAMRRAGASDLPARQRTMRATLDWSYRLLGGAEQTLLRRLAVCTGGCDLAAVEALAADLDDPLGALERLVEHSLVTVVDAGEPRYVMLEPVLQHARSLLPAEELTAARTAHATYYGALAQEAAPRYEREEQVLWLEKVGVEDGNLTSALEWWVESGDGERAGAMAWALWLYWWLRGQLLRGRRLGEAALRLPMSDRTRVRTTLTVASTSYAQGDVPTSARMWAHAEEISAAADFAEGLLYSTAGNGLVALAEGDPARAERSLTAALEHAERVGPERAWVVGLVHIWRGTARLLDGDPAAAVPHIRSGLASARERGDRLSTYIALYNLVQAALAEGRLDDAREYLEEGIGLSEETSDLANLSFFLESLAVVEGAAGRHERVGVLLGASAGMRDRVGSSVYGYYLPDPALRQHAEGAAHEALGDEALDLAVVRGRAMTPAQAVRYALRPEAVPR